MSEIVWHPIKKVGPNHYEGLPDWGDVNDNDEVLVTLTNGSVSSDLLVEAEIEGEGYLFDTYTFDEVTAWARFPEPYKGDEENSEDSA